MSAPRVAFHLRGCSRAAARTRLVAFLDQHEADFLRRFVTERVLRDDDDVEGAVAQLQEALAESRADVLRQFEPQPSAERRTDP